MSLTLSQVLVFSLLILFLIVGLSYKKGPQTMREYALGNKKFSTSALIYTMVATTFGGGSIIGASAALYQHGAWLFLASFAIPISYCILSLVIVPKLSKYYGCISIAEVIGKMYGTYARRLIGIVAFIYCLGILGAQIKALYWVMEHVFMKNALIATVIGVLIVILYSSMGGVTSIIKIDVIQFFIFIIIIPLIALIASYIIQMSGGISQITSSIPESKLGLFYKENIFIFVSIVFSYILPDISPDCFHRFLIGRDCKKNQAASYAAAFVSLINTIFVGCITFIAISKFPSIEPQNAMLIVIQNFITAKWIVILFSIALVSMIISTADSLVNTGAILLINDVVTKNITEPQKIKLLRVATILSGFVALSFAYLFSNVLDIVLFFTECYLVLLVVPLVSGLFISEIKREHFWISVSAAFITFFSLHLSYRDLNHEISLLSFMASLCAYFIAYFAFKKQNIQNVTFPIRTTCDEIIKNHPIQSSNLSWIILLFFTLSIFLKATSDKISIITLVLEGIAGILGILLFFVDKASIRYKNVIILGTIWYCFAFFPAHIFLHQKMSNIFTINFIVSMVLLAGLFSWDIFLTFLLSGSILAAVLFCFSGQDMKSLITTFMYLGLLMSYIGIVAYIAFRKKDLGILGFIRNKFKSKDSLVQASIYSKILHANKAFLAADEKYKNILLREQESVSVSLKDLKENILAYFQQMSVVNKTELIVVNSGNKVLNTVLPLNFFYKIVYSLILNVFYSGNSEKIKIRFCYDNKNKIKTIEISHGKYKLNDRMPYFKGPYPHNILRWEEINALFKMLDIKTKEGISKLQVIFPSESTPTESNIIDLKEFIKTHSKKISANKSNLTSYEDL
jgi:Na+/proline symporter